MVYPDRWVINFRDNERWRFHDHRSPGFEIRSRGTRDEYKRNEQLLRENPFGEERMRNTWRGIYDKEDSWNFVTIFLHHILFKERDFAYLNVIDLYRMLFEINFGI